MTRTLAVDLTAPAASYTAPAALKVGVAIADMTPSTTATDITSYGATGLPSGLSVNSTTGVISGTPDTADADPATATVTGDRQRRQPRRRLDHVPRGGQGRPEADGLPLQLRAR